MFLCVVLHLTLVIICLILVIKYTLKAFYGKWVMRFGRFSFTLLFTRGRVTLNKKVIKVTPSRNKRYPFSQGWFIYYYRGWTYYIRRSGRSRIYIFRMNKGGKVVKGKDRFLFTIGKPKLYTLPAQLALSFYCTVMNWPFLYFFIIYQAWLIICMSFFFISLLS